MSETKHISLKNLQAFLKPLMRMINRKAESWEDLKNKPFGSTFAECTLTDKLKLLANEQFIALGDFYFIEGQKYTVLFDDITYNCTAYKDNYGTVNIGDITLMGESHPKSQDAPFFIFSDIDDGARIFVEDNSVDHSILITGISETITKLPSKYVDIPKGILTEDNYLQITAGMQKGNGEVFNNYDGNSADGYMSHAEGSGTWADGGYSHAEGLRTRATGEESHAEGYQTEANGDGSHAEGCETTASGRYSHAEGFDTIASGAYQHVQGKYNIENNTYAHIVGNGKNISNNPQYVTIQRSNAHTLDWNGNAWFAGDVYVGSTGGLYQDDGSKKLATEEYVGTDVSGQIAEHNISATAHNDIRDLITAPKNGIAFIDQVNGYTYVVCMREGNLVIYSAVKSIEVTSMPNKTEYTVGEYFDPTGMIVMAVCDDGTTKDITSKVYSDPLVNIGEILLNINYEEAGIIHKASIPVIVNEFDPSVVLVDFNYTTNSNGTYTITKWKQTYNGSPSTEMVVPNNHLILL